MYLQSHWIFSASWQVTVVCAKNFLVRDLRHFSEPEFLFSPYHLRKFRLSFTPPAVLRISLASRWVGDMHHAQVLSSVDSVPLDAQATKDLGEDHLAPFDQILIESHEDEGLSSVCIDEMLLRTTTHDLTDLSTRFVIGSKDVL